MNIPLLEKFTVEKTLIYIIIAAVLITFIFIFYLFFSHFTKNIQVISPVGGEEWEIGQTYQITWKARGIEKVGIVLFKGTEPKWIAKSVYAKLGKYEWKIYPGQEYGSDYWIAVFEYPWQKGNIVNYSDGAFAVVFPELGSCEGLSIQSEWPYLPSDFPNLRRVFITSASYTGSLGGLDGVDQKCQEQAQAQGFEGDWLAFIGGDDERETAIERLKATPGSIGGIYVEARVATTLIRGATCHRLLGKDFNEFLGKFVALSVINEEKFTDTFFQDLGDLWIGRLGETSKKNCTSIASVLTDPYKALAEKYSLTTTCQNWTQENMYVQGYPVPYGGAKPSFPTCYTPQGKSTDAVALGGLSTGLVRTEAGISFTPYQGKYCSTKQKLLCIEE